MTIFNDVALSQVLLESASSSRAPKECVKNCRYSFNPEVSPVQLFMVTRTTSFSKRVNLLLLSIATGYYVYSIYRDMAHARCMHGCAYRNTVTI